MKGKIVGFLIACVALGCGGSGGRDLSIRVRFINLSPDTVSLSYSLDDKIGTTALSYGSFTTTPYLGIAGDVDIATYEDGTTTTLDSIVDDLSADSDQFVVTYGQKNFGTENEKRLQVQLIKPNIVAPNGSKSKLVIFHALNRASGSQTPGITFKNPGTTPVNTVNVSYGTYQILTVDSGSQDFDVKSQDTEQIFKSATLNLAPGKVYVVAISGIEGGSGSQAADIKTFVVN